MGTGVVNISFSLGSMPALMYNANMNNVNTYVFVKTSPLEKCSIPNCLLSEMCSPQKVLQLLLA